MNESVDVTQVVQLSERVLSEVETAIVGKRPILQKIFAAVLVGGHVLLEDFPGLGKTLLANSFAQALGLSFKRVQFTPDLLPNDITGGYIFDRAANEFVLRQGPIFANLLLADEINRASPKTQSALLEAMQEKQTTLEGDTMPLPDPFIVMATQNPIEYEGTFPLPEAQLDRFMMKLSLGYPAADDEVEILRRRQSRQQDSIAVKQVTDADALNAAKVAVENVHVHEDLLRYMVDLVTATRTEGRIAVGASPRASLALLSLSRAWAAMAGRSYVLPDDIKAFAHPVLEHRIILRPDLWMQSGAAEAAIEAVVAGVKVPVIDA